MAADERLAALRRSGVQRLDPLGFAVVESLAKRAAAHDGEVRRQLDQRLAQWMDAIESRVAAGKPPQPRNVPTAHPLAELRQRLGAEAATPKALADFAGTWTRLRTEQRLAQSLARAPDNAGPLNSHALVLRTLRRLQQLSPEYLDRFVGYAEALLAVDAAGLPADVPLRETARPVKRARAAGR